MIKNSHSPVRQLENPSNPYPPLHASRGCSECKNLIHNRRTTADEILCKQCSIERLFLQEYPLLSDFLWRKAAGSPYVSLTDEKQVSTAVSMAAVSAALIVSVSMRNFSLYNVSINFHVRSIIFHVRNNKHHPYATSIRSCYKINCADCAGFSFESAAQKS
jgi:hypothetical protein